MSNDLLQVTTQPDDAKKIKEKIDSVPAHQGLIVKSHQSFSIMNNVIEKNVEYIDKSTVVFISGSNLVCYDIDKKTSKFLNRKYSNFLITSMSVGYRTVTDHKADPYVCLGEYNPHTKVCQISTISVKNPNIQFILNNGVEKEKNMVVEWQIFLSKILNNSSYCLAVSKRMNNSGMTLSKVSFWKYTQEKFISEVVLQENLNYCSYNPQNPLELILCGKGYLRLWNVFINEGSLKEHPQRFLRGKIEKEHNFLKAQFFDKKSFVFIVGTSENIFYIMEGFQVIYDFNASYSMDNISEMNIQKVLQVKSDEDEEDETVVTGGVKQTDFIGVNDSKDSIHSERMGTKNSLSTKDDSKILFENNPLRTFFLINNQFILMGFQKSSIIYTYKLDKDFKSKKEKEMLLNKDSDEKKNSIEDMKVTRLANNVKSIINMMTNPDKSQVMFMMEVYNNEKFKFSKKDEAGQETSICVYLFNRVGSKLIFAGEVFKEYFCFNSILSFDFNEKKKLIYTITDNNWLRCFDYNIGAFSIKHHFSNDTPIMITVCPHNNLFGVCFSHKFILYALFRDNIKVFCEFDVVNPYAKFTLKGDYIAIAGESQVNKNYCIYFIDTLYFNTAYVLENLPKIKKIQFMDNDNYLFALSESSVILGWNVRFDLITISIMNRLKEYEKSVESYYFKLMYKHMVKGSDYSDFDYDSANDLLLVIYKNMDRMSVYSKLGKNLYTQIDLQKRPVLIKIVKEQNVAFAGMDDGSLRIYKWPFDSNDGHSIDSKQIIYEINLHSRDLNNLLISDTFRHIITASNDGSLIFSTLLTVRDNRMIEYDHFYEQGVKLKPVIEDIMRLCDVFEFRITDIKKKDKKVEDLDETIKATKQNIFEQKDAVVTEHKSEIKNLDFQKEDAISEEYKKEEQLRVELKNLKFNIENELENRHKEHDNEKECLATKYKKKLQLYKNEIDRLHNELKELQHDIEEKFQGIAHSQTDHFKSMYSAYNIQYNEMTQKIDNSLKKLVTESAEYDDAIYTISSHYKEMMKDLGKKIDETEVKNQMDMTNLKKALDSEKTREGDYKNSLDHKVQESDKVIHKNAEIKKNIIDTTQRTITFQEQLLETEKNLRKISLKMKDLDTKNKHLEQIRFVLEHRMTSLYKEKAPLEGQCVFLEKQKNSLQEEFNKLILQINLKNQFLENKQSQLRASLIQNFEINDQVLYVKKKLMHLQTEIKAFIIMTQDSENENGLSLQENKATYVILKLRQFYDKYFSNTIDHELNNYQYYLAKLQEETEKLNIANNYDLIMRDKGEEKLLSEKEKLEQIKMLKERGFRRMQNENTILIAECNRLRKNLHEVYMHVVDIESKFEGLTKINHNLNKTEIVYQIKEFIVQTHNKIKSNLNEGNSNFIEEEQINFDQVNTNFMNGMKNFKDNFNPDDFGNEFGNDIIRSVNENNENIISQNLNLDDIKDKVKSALNNSSEKDKNAYENFLKLPDINSNNRSINSDHSNDMNSINKYNSLPTIPGK